MCIYFWLCVGFSTIFYQHVIITYLILYINNVLSKKYQNTFAFPLDIYKKIC
nr:MAG TPA: hypothetical protein [Caudoviricetes sp.]